MRIPTDEQKIEFWESYSIKPQIKITNIKHHNGMALDGSGDMVEVYPSIGLNSLFKYAVEDEWEVHFYFDKSAQDHNCIIVLPNGTEYDGAGDNHADALFWALSKILVKEGSNGPTD